MITSNRILPLVGLVAAFGLMTGCASKASTSEGGEGAAEVVAQGSDAHQSESDSESLATSLIGGGSGSVSLASAGELMAGGSMQLEDVPLADGGLGRVGAALKGYAAGCVVVTDDKPTKTATYVFTNCTGPYGLVNVNGTVTVTYAPTPPNKMTLTFAAKGLTVNKATVDWNATADITATGDARDMVWNGKISGTTGKGRAFSRTNTKDFKWTVGGDCIEINGESDGTVTGHELKTDVINYNRCKGSCPQAGSEIKITDVTASKVYDVKFNADDATYTGPNGKSTNFTPPCAL